MWHFVKGLTQIQRNDINLFSYIEISSKVIDSSYELAFTRMVFPEAILLFAQNVILAKVIIDIGVDIVFKNFTRDTS